MESIQIVGVTGEPVDVVDGCLLGQPRDEFADAVEAGRAFAWSSLTYDYDAADTILGVQNDSDDYDLVIQRIWVTGDAATQIVVHTSAGVVMAGTAVPGVNLNRGSAFVAPATAIADETGNVQAAAVYTGRIATGRIAANGAGTLEIGGAIVLPRGWNVGVDFTTTGTACNATIVGYFRARE